MYRRGTSDKTTNMDAIRLKINRSSSKDYSPLPLEAILKNLLGFLVEHIILQQECL